MRPATPQAKELCEIWCKKDSTPEQKLHALRVATIEHSRLVKECSIGFGVDRHLFALQCIAQREGLPTPEFFKSDAWKKLNHTILSTSNCGNPSLRLFGFGPVVPDGFGIGYIIKDSGLSFSVSSKHRQTKRYVHSLSNTLKEMHELLKPKYRVEVEQRVPLTAHPHIEIAHTTYDDIFGESSYVPPPKKSILQAVAEEPPQGHRRRSQRPSKRASQFFANAKEFSLSFEHLLDPDVQMILDLEGKESDDRDVFDQLY